MALLAYAEFCDAQYTLVFFFFLHMSVVASSRSCREINVYCVTFRVADEKILTCLLMSRGSPGVTHRM